MTRLLRDYFDGGEVIRPGEFADLGHADSPVPGTLTYCDAEHYINIANRNANVS